MEQEFRDSIQKALHNPNLTGALGRFSEAYRVSRAKAYEGIDFEAVRTRIAEIKSYAASHFDELADRFARNAEARGAKVFRTDDPQEVRDYILNVAKENGVKSIVKSKSMASEEIHLNRYLEEAGIEVRETDLGEWIIQLAGQTPSHMVMPAIHMTKEEVAEVFSDKVEAGQAPDIPRLVKFARGKLRTKFLKADMGITGANIAVAETGRLVIVTNEGNARLATTLPKIHVAIVGLEKLVRALRGHRADPHRPAPQRHGAAAHQLRLHHHRPGAQHRRHAQGAAHHPHGQPPHADGATTRSSSRRCSASAAPPA